MKDIPICNVEDAMQIIKGEITFGSLLENITKTPKIKTYGLTKKNAQAKINQTFDNANSNKFADGLMSDNIEDVQKAFKKLFVGCKVTIKTIEDSKEYKDSLTEYKVKVKGVGTFHIIRVTKSRNFDLCRVDYTLDNGTGGILVNNLESGVMKVTDVDAKQFVTNLNYKCNEKLKTTQL